MYIRKRWILLTFVLVLGIAIGYIYIKFFQTNNADEVCCVKHYLKVPPVLTITESTAIPILDSSKANQQITYNILNQVQEGLMRLGPNNIPVLGLAESYQVSPDYRTYTFTIRKNAVWSDGKAVTASDFKFAWQRALSPEDDYAFSYLFYPIHNAEAYSLGKVGAEQIGITADDEKRLTIQLDRPDPNFLSLVTLTPFLPLPKERVEKYGEDYATSPVPESMSYSGPYQLKSFNPGSAVLIKNPVYWDSRNVKLKEIKIDVKVDEDKRSSLYKSELTSMSKTNKKQRENFKQQKAISTYLIFNQGKENLQNFKLRQAIQLALNTTEMVTDLSDESSAASSLVPPVLITNQRKAFKTDLQLKSNLTESKRLLHAGLTDLGISGSLNLSLLTYDDSRSLAIANEIKKQLLKVGILVNIEKYNVKKKEEKESNGEYDLSINEWFAEYHDPSIFLNIFTSKAMENTSNFSDKQYDTLIEKASLEANPAKRDQYLHQAEKYLIVDKAVIKPLVYVNDLRLQKPYVKNVLYHPFGADYSLKWATYQPPKQIEATK
ncbi:peptide ABC transporter substrate-binding protein [Shimazuella kribbensis]|uniref:peptide ABC transporter substrate-binding protein n=1 Tax=Shimazuella kribbensis TaxID=139808 RepID=UPI00040D3B70|nr:peptide ABC transporter substrate-binding protein [Shimazuella kribbensis]